MIHETKRKTIKIASTHRRFRRCGVDHTCVTILYFDLTECRFIIRYRDTNIDCLPGTNEIVEECTINSLNNFVRPQFRLDKESHLVNKWPCDRIWYPAIRTALIFKEKINA